VVLLPLAALDAGAAAVVAAAAAVVELTSSTL
jgi:hypothetical protein